MNTLPDFQDRLSTPTLAVVSRSLGTLVIVFVVTATIGCSQQSVSVKSSDVRFAQQPLGHEPVELFYTKGGQEAVITTPAVNARFEISRPIDTGAGVGTAVLVYGLKTAQGSRVARLQCPCKLIDRKIICTEQTLKGTLNPDSDDFEGELTISLEGVYRDKQPISIPLFQQPFKAKFVSNLKLQEGRDRELAIQRQQREEEDVRRAREQIQAQERIRREAEENANKK